MCNNYVCNFSHLVFSIPEPYIYCDYHDFAIYDFEICQFCKNKNCLDCRRRDICAIDRERVVDGVSDEPINCL